MISQHGKGSRGDSWSCLCDCGKTTIMTTTKLTKGGYKSCGCGLKRTDNPMRISKELRKLFPLSASTWKSILSRCYYVGSTKQKCYEKVSICDRWLEFSNFVEDMGERPSIDHSIDRVDPNDGYHKDNCRWVTKKENSSRADRNYTEERNKKVSQGVKRAHSLGLILTESTRKKIGLGGAKRAGRKFQKCSKCGGGSYLPVCSKCRVKS